MDCVWTIYDSVFIRFCATVNFLISLFDGFVRRLLFELFS